MRFNLITKVLMGIVLILSLGLASVQAEYPEKPITLILQVGAGGSHDRNARVFTSVIPEYLGNAMIVRLMGGASGQIGTAAAAKAKTDLELVGQKIYSSGFMLLSYRLTR